MITKEEISAKAEEFSLKPSEVEKDYVYGWLLSGIYAQSPLRTHLILKGGNGLRKVYLANTRFSKDLDFSVQQSIAPTLLKEELQRVCEFVERETGVHFSKDRAIVKEKDLPFGIDALEARLYFNGFYGHENLVLKAQVDVTQFDKLYLPVQERALLHPYSDHTSCTGIVRCQKIEEILASKLTTLLHRRKAIDLFDLLYSIIFTKEFPVSRREVVTTFLKKSIFEPHPLSARDQLLAIPLAEFEPFWSAIVAPIGSILKFDYVVSNFRSLIESLFEMIVQPVATAATPTPFRQGLRGRMFPQPRGNAVSSHQSLGYFPSGIRNTIVSAGRSLTLVELVYDGWRRLVEPYKIEYYVRKKDGMGLEYFWGYDTTGGKSGPGIKRFICDKIQSARMTDRAFVPRESVQL